MNRPLHRLGSLRTVITRILRSILGCVLVTLTVSACAATPSRTALVTKLEHVNGLTHTEAKCVADGLYDGIPAKGAGHPAIVKLTTSELRSVAKPDNAGKVQPATLQKLRDVVTRCVPNGSQVPLS